MIKKITATLSLAVLLILAGCAKASPAGSWRLIEMSDETSGMFISEENLAAMGEYTMQLYEDGSGLMYMAGKSVSLQWDGKTITLTDSEPQPYTMDGGKLRLQDLDAVLVFVRDE